MKRLIVTAILLCTTTGFASVSAEKPHRAIYDRVPEVLEFLHDHNVKTVGVLKFRVKKPGESVSDSVGAINSLLADRLEIGLILKNSPLPERQIGIIRNASDQASSIDGANHLTEAGRQRLFAPQYELAWGSDRQSADAFLTGIVQLHDDHTTATVGLLCFLKGQPDLVRIGDAFTIPMDSSLLSEMGESFVLRGAFDGGSTSAADVKPLEEVHQEVAQQTVEIHQQKEKFPTQLPQAPVRLEVRYDGRVVKPELRSGKAFLPTPHKGQEVEFSIRRTSHARGTLGVVLKVNGENTLYRETLADIECSKWLLTPDWTETVVRGYQLDNGTAEQFAVLSESESRRKAVDYGRNVGQVQLTVFAKDTSSPLELVDEEDQDMIALLRGTHPEARPDNLSALKIQLSEPDPGVRRGLINPGEETDSAINEVTFDARPGPIMAITITYYTP